MKIILVRHGETSWNKEQIFRGRKDIELNRNGLLQAKNIRKYLSNEHVDAIYSSPLIRAVSTAKEIVKYHKLDVRIAKELIDFDFGVWEGLTIKQVQNKYSKQFNIWETNPESLKIPKGETIPDLEKRLKEFINYLKINYFEQTIVIVSHRVVLKLFVLLTVGFGIDYFWSIKLDPCSISIVESLDKNRFILTRLNEIPHLTEYKNQADF